MTIDKAVADERIQEGWLRAWLGFSALAADEEIAKAALVELVDKLEKEDNVKLYKKDFGDFVKHEKPLPNIDVGWSGTAEVEFAVKDFDTLLHIVMHYGPSAAEILEPSKLTLNVGQAQRILNSVAMMMHQFAAAGLGGIVFVRGKEK